MYILHCKLFPLNFSTQFFHLIFPANICATFFWTNIQHECAIKLFTQLCHQIVHPFFSFNLLTKLFQQIFTIWSNIFPHWTNLVIHFFHTIVNFIVSYVSLWDPGFIKFQQELNLVPSIGEQSYTEMLLWQFCNLMIYVKLVGKIPYQH